MPTTSINLTTSEVINIRIHLPVYPEINISSIDIVNTDINIPTVKLTNVIFPECDPNLSISLNTQVPSSSIHDVITEIPIGDVDGINCIFYTTKQYKKNKISLFINGIKQSNSYFTESEDRLYIVISEPPSNVGFTDLIEVLYFY